MARFYYTKAQILCYNFLGTIWSVAFGVKLFSDSVEFKSLYVLLGNGVFREYGGASFPLKSKGKRR